MSTPEHATVPTPVDPSTWNFETRQIHAGAAPDPTTGARATPIYQTTSYTFRDTDHAAALFSLAEPGNIYTRLMNPTTDVVEQRVASLEGGVAALLVASGQAAESLTILTICEAGDHLVASPSLYGGTYNLLHHTLPKLGVAVTFVEDPDDLEQWAAAVQPNTKLFYGETIGNPGGDLLDLVGISGVAHARGIPLVVDNTVATPYLLRPLEHGADIVVHSATKYLGGHGTSIAGVIVDGGRFDWTQGRFASFTTPDPSYHGAVFADLGAPAFVLKARVQGLRDLGAAASPFNAFLINQGIETLSLRMERHVANAQAVAEFLDAREDVERVTYAGLSSSPWHARAKELTPKGPGAVLAFEIAGGLAAGKRFVDGLALHSHVANIGDVRSLVIHPASTTHRQLTDDQRVGAGAGPDTVRLSVGIEDVADLIADLEQALDQALAPAAG